VLLYLVKVVVKIPLEMFPHDIDLQEKLGSLKAPEKQER
jgi:hypothetical protein